MHLANWDSSHDIILKSKSLSQAEIAITVTLVSWRKRSQLQQWGSHILGAGRARQEHHPRSRAFENEALQLWAGHWDITQSRSMGNTSDIRQQRWGSVNRDGQSIVEEATDFLLYSYHCSKRQMEETPALSVARGLAESQWFVFLLFPIHSKREKNHYLLS